MAMPTEYIYCQQIGLLDVSSLQFKFYGLITSFVFILINYKFYQYDLLREVFLFS